MRDFRRMSILNRTPTGFLARTWPDLSFANRFESRIGQVFQFIGNLFAFVKRNPALDRLGLPGITVRDLRVGVQARTSRVTPSALTMIESQNHPAVAGFAFAGRERGRENLVVVRLCRESCEPLQHAAHLNMQASQVL